MRLVSTMLAALAVFTAALPVAAGTACASSALQLNEFLAGPARDWDGSGAFSSRDDEWVEVVNTGGTTLDLSAFVITDGDSIPRLALSGSLGAGQVLVVYGKQSFDWEKAHGYPAFGLSLGNSGDKVMLWQVTGTDTALVDSYTYSSHEAASDRAVGRDPSGTGAWALFDGLNPYTGTTAPIGTGCSPSPGVPNQCSTTPARPVTWGRIKTLYH
jgi:lamin tail-like protein